MAWLTCNAFPVRPVPFTSWAAGVTPRPSEPDSRVALAVRRYHSDLVAAEGEGHRRGARLDECEETARLRQGVLDSGVVHGRLISPGPFRRYSLTMHPRRGFSCPPSWQPATTNVTSCSTPSALGAVGVPAAALESADAWRSWLAGR